VRVLVIEDERPIAAVIKRGLEKAGYSVDLAYDGVAGLQAALDLHPSLIILDLMLPGKDGWTVCQELRALRISTPILMLTARGAVEDRVRGLEAGGDDYLPKPFHFAELLARVRSLVRRDQVHKAPLIRIHDLEIDTGARRVTRAGVEIPLTRREYDLLEVLAANEGRVLTRDVLLERVWGDDEMYSNTVDVHIALLRRKVDANHDVKLIHTVRGVGYTLKAQQGGAQ